MIHVHVAYCDGTDAKVPLADIGDLRTDGVLMIVVLSDEINPKTGKPHGRIQQCSRFDHYALCSRAWESNAWTMLFGYDEADYKWVRHARPWDSCSRFPTSPPISVMHVTFHGGAVSDEDWKAMIEKADRKLR
jgi:hypothetical protein